jgi:hypothetical protein
MVKSGGTATATESALEADEMIVLWVTQRACTATV